jgi:hypothetical protein
MNKSSPPAPSSATGALSLPEIKPTLPPHFPTFEELVEQDLLQQTTPAPKRKLLDLFDGILGDLSLLLTDFQEHPEKYGEEVHDLLEQLTRGSKSLEQLSASDRRLLNYAVFDFMQDSGPKPEVKKPRKLPTRKLVTKSKAKRRAARSLRKSASKTRKPGPATSELPAFWWLPR